jgi:hypothetical protein
MQDETSKSEPPAEPDAQGNSLEDASRDAVREMKERAEGTGHAGAGDIG